MQAPGAQSKYRPLYDYLVRRRGAGETIVRLTFSQIDRMLGDRDVLPVSASNHRAWWGNEDLRPGRQSRAWLAAGWRVESIELLSGAVTFGRAIDE